MGRTRKVKRISRRRTNRVKRSRINNKRVKRSKRTRINNKRTKRKSRMKRGGYLGEGIINRLRRNSAGPAWIKVKDRNLEFLTLENGDPTGTPSPSVNRAYKVSGRIREGPIGRKKNYLLLEYNPILKILEENAEEYDISAATLLGKTKIGKDEVGREFDARHT